MEKGVYLISKDNDLIKRIKESLEPNGYSVIISGGQDISFLLPDGLNGLILIDSPILRDPEFTGDLFNNRFMIIISNREEKGMILEAMRKGAYGYLEKPIDTEELVVVVNKIIGTPDKDEISTLGRGGKLRRLLKDIKRLSGENIPVVISGEDGIDLEFYARALHKQGRRKGFFLSLNPSKGEKIRSMIGYLRDGSGNLEGSSIFLEDLYGFDPGVIRELSAVVQGKDIWLIAGAFHKDYDIDEERKKEFLLNFDREITIPPLRERKEEIPAIIENLLRRMENQFRFGKKNLSSAARSYLLKYNWPGNDREIEDTIRKAYLLSEGEIIEKRDIFGNMSLCPLEEFLSLRLKGLLKENSNLYQTVIKEVEKALINLALQEAEGNQLRTSRILGINRNTLRTKIKEHGLDRLLTK